MRNLGSVWGVTIPDAIFNTYSSSAAGRLSDPAVGALFVDGGAYERATRLFMRTLDARPALKAEMVQLYVDRLRVVWQASVAFAPLAFALAFLVPTIEFRDELNTEYGLKGQESAESNEPSDKASTSC